MRSILVVDDEPDVLRLVCDLLQDEGYDAIPLDGPRALTTEEQCREPDLFLLDMNLPVMSGIELARRLRDDGFPNTPMVAMSASPSMLHAAASTQLFQGILAKPFDFEELLEYAERYAS
ncbi:MAG: response regulator [Chloroflexota bacterium]|nr:response regulator [Chloroflexota bacterium]